MAITRHATFTALEPDNLALTVSPSPKFLAKNEQVDEMLGPLRITSFLVRDEVHLLCPVHSFKDNIECTEGVSDDHLFYNSKFRKHLPIKP